MLVHRITSSIHLMSPLTSARVEVLSNVYFAKPMIVVLTSSHLVPFVVLDINPVAPREALSGNDDKVDAMTSSLAEAEVFLYSLLFSCDNTQRLPEIPTWG